MSNDQNEYPEAIPEREPETRPHYVPVDPADLPEGIMQAMMQRVGEEANHRMAVRVEKQLAHANTETEETEAATLTSRFISSLTTSELRDVLGFVLAHSAARHRRIDDESRRIWRFITKTAKDPGSTVILGIVAVLVGAIAVGRRW